MRIPSLPIAASVRAAAGAGEAERDGRPVALVVGRGAAARVARADAAAGAAGVRPGQRVAAARACAATLRLLPWDDELYARAQEDLLALLLGHSPAVTLAGLGRAWLDAGGQEHLGGEAALAARLLAALRAAGHADAQVAVAGTVVAAEAAAQGGEDPPRCVPPGQDAAFLAPLPLDRIPLPDDLREVLALLGLGTLGEVAALAPASLELRFGAAGLRARDLASGRDPRGPVTPVAPDGLVVTVDLDPPGESLPPLVFAARSALVSLLRSLAPRGRRVGRLRLHLLLDDRRGAPQRTDVGLGRPTAHLDPLLDRCRAHLETLTLAAPVRALALEVLETVAATAGDQGELFAARFRDAEALAAALSRIRARCGSASVVRPEPVDAHALEAQGRFVPDLDPPPARARAAPAPALRAARRILPTPQPVAVRTGLGQLTAVRLEQRWHPVVRATPPARLSGAWWTAGPVDRQDCLVVTAAGARLHLVRPLPAELAPPEDGAAESWLLVGWED